MTQEEVVSPEDVIVTQDYFSMSPTNNEIFSSLASAQGQIEAAGKNQVNPFHKSKYADIHDIGQAVKGPLKAAGLFYMQMWERGASANEVRIRTMIGHKSGEFIQFISSIRCAEPDNPQKVGALLTYGKRYALAGALGVTSTERSLDDDGNSLSVSDKELLEKLEKSARDGNFQVAWKALPQKEREKIAAHDLEKLKKVKSHGTAKPTVVRGAGQAANRV